MPVSATAAPSVAASVPPSVLGWLTASSSLPDGVGPPARPPTGTGTTWIEHAPSAVKNAMASAILPTLWTVPRVVSRAPVANIQQRQTPECPGGKCAMKAKCVAPTGPRDILKRPLTVVRLN